METQALFLFCEKLSKECVCTFLKKSTKKPGNRSEWFPKRWLQRDAFRADPPCRRKGGRIPFYEYPLFVSVRNEEAETAILLSVA